ncbi:helix-turn-helix transcriptional regulator [Rhodococcus sp. 1168]|uniref:helix-turn-helix transcriptional regulator n=1 Tax=Rhodococcus sp. 1168 TaxID=2018041 RepID=UPI0020CB0C36|nr:helix-turn-helix transcriptional regulator [Rhodococcus sp. 1168]
MIRDGLGFDCATLVGPPRAVVGDSHPVVVNLDYPGEAVQYIATTYATQCPAHRYAIENRVARRFIDLPYDFRDSRTYLEALKPCGFHEGLTVPLPLPLGSVHGIVRPGFLALSSIHRRPLDNAARLALTMLAAELSILTDPHPEQCRPPAELVIWAGQGRVESRVGDRAAAPFADKLVARIEALHSRDGTGLRFRHRDATGRWWHVTTDSAREGVLVRLMQVEPDVHLTARELDVVGLASRGWTNDDIALSLGVSVRTARSHIESVLLKLGVPNRTALAREAMLRDLDSLDAIRCVAETAPASVSVPRHLRTVDRRK